MSTVLFTLHLLIHSHTCTQCTAKIAYHQTQMGEGATHVTMVILEHLSVVSVLLTLWKRMANVVCSICDMLISNYRRYGLFARNCNYSNEYDFMPISIHTYACTQSKLSVARCRTFTFSSMPLPAMRSIHSAKR